MFSVTLIGAVLATGGPPGVCTPEKPPRDVREVTEFVTRAVVNGLTEDGAPRDLAAALAANDKDYLMKCVLCGAARAGLVAYARLPTRPAGNGLPAATSRRLTAADAAVRHAALRDLVADYVVREYDRRGTSAADRKGMDDAMAFYRKLMAARLTKGQEFCPSCDGACRIRPRLTS